MLNNKDQISKHCQSHNFLCLNLMNINEFDKFTPKMNSTMGRHRMI